MERIIFGTLTLSGDKTGLSLKDLDGKTIDFDGEILFSLSPEPIRKTLRTVFFKITNSEQSIENAV